MRTDANDPLHLAGLLVRVQSEEQNLSSEPYSP
jgi:hypothetical protein